MCFCRTLLHGMNKSGHQPEDQRDHHAPGPDNSHSQQQQHGDVVHKPAQPERACGKSAWEMLKDMIVAEGYGTAIAEGSASPCRTQDTPSALPVGFSLARLSNPYPAAFQFVKR